MAVYLGSNEVNLRGGQPMENGLPLGGLTGQVLAKSSNDDYVAAWTTVYDVPAGGSVGQVLAKSSDDDYALTWTSIESDPALPSGGTIGQALVKRSGTSYDVQWSSIVGIPSRGAVGTVLAKTNETDYKVGWSIPHYIPLGGATGQVINKKSATDYDIEWKTPHYIPSGGTTGQVLKKNSGTSYDVSWANESGGGGGESDLLFCEVDSTQHTSSMTFAEIAAAITAGKRVVLVVADPNRGDILGGLFNAGGSDASAQATYIDEQMSQLLYYTVYVTEEQAEVYTITYTLTPAG